MEKIGSSNIIIAENSSNPDDKESVSLQIPKGQTAEISLKGNESKPSFMMVGNGRKNNSLDKEIDIMDFIKLVTHMTPQELFVIGKIKDHLIQESIERVSPKNGKTYKDNYLTNVGFVRMTPFTNADQQKFKTGFKRLNAKNIVRRTERSHYIFNPSFIVPSKFFEKTLKQWDNADKPKTLNENDEAKQKKVTENKIVKKKSPENKNIVAKQIDENLDVSKLL